ncbi:ZZ-type zinc finger-containing protein 3-like isoform X2 [Corticium candelabrum]|uniref:ZZ-type zinc finger-containing protein 3-like isoform X2 n=1 Tax=Corticium candelabrum TaxID=121492 RepID=UPI002E262521|nr:ZZ-type zinc finger-containing protein 3-like isoform X2 [Corticium candelabrum]
MVYRMHFDMIAKMELESKDRVVSDDLKRTATCIASAAGAECGCGQECDENSNTKVDIRHRHSGTRMITSECASGKEVECKDQSHKKLIVERETGENTDMEDKNSDHTFCFESDHLALKNNTDYQKLLQALVCLERQRCQAIQDLEKLYAMQDQALNDPTSFIQQLRNKTDVLEKEVPKAQALTQVPTIYWQAYGSAAQEAVNIATADRNIGKRKMTDNPTPTANTAGAGSSQKQVKHPSEGAVVRGRVYSQTKPVTFNQLWKPEEQAKLEELLVKYPSEETETRRWEKIAREMPHRAPKQIASRVQKYFIKLAKAGLPIPGRMPSSNMYKKSKPNSYSVLSKPSTFFSTHRPHVLMDNDDDYIDETHSVGVAEAVQSHSAAVAHRQPTKVPHLEDDSEDELLSDPLLWNTDEYEELVRLQELRKVRLQCNNVELHEPDTKRCLPVSNCVSEQSSMKTNCIDRDYVSSGVYSYLDPNYQPTES